jgi:hypothetical protein
MSLALIDQGGRKDRQVNVKGLYWVARRLLGEGLAET